MPKNSAWRAPRSLPTLLTRLCSRPSGAGEIIARTACAAHLTLNFGVLLHKLWRIDKCCNSRSEAARCTPRLQLNAFLLTSINLNLKRRQRASKQSAKAPQSNCRAACVCSPGGHDQCWCLHQVMQKDAQSAFIAANSLIDRQAGSELTRLATRG